MMGGQNKNTVNMPLSELFSFGDKLTGEEAAEFEAGYQASQEAAGRTPEEQLVLACAGEFQELGLRLYQVHDRIQDRLQDGWMLGNGKEQFLGVVPSEDGDVSFTGKETPVMHYPMEAAGQGGLPSLAVEIRYFLRLGDVCSSRARCADGLRPIPPELHGKMADARLIQPKAGSYSWELTPLGAQYGLVHGLLLLDGRRTCSTFFIEAEALDALEALLAGGWPGRGAQGGRRHIPMGERLERLALGLPGDGACAAELLGRLGDMPLEQYMGHIPAKLEQLQRELPGGRAGTVREAAARISGAWHTPGRSMKQCEDLIWLLLVEPMVDGMKKFRNFC